MSLALGIPVSELSERMTAQELHEWAAFERDFGPLTVQERVDVAGAVAGFASLKAMGAKNVGPEDLLPAWAKRQPRQQTAEEMMAVMRGLMAKQPTNRKAQRRP